MFRFGRRAGYMAIATLVLAVLPLVVTLVFYPQLGDQVAMRFNSAGEVTRWGSKVELLWVPALALGLGALGTLTAYRQASKFADEPAMARTTFTRQTRNCLLTAILLAAACLYLLYAAVTGHGFGF